MEVPKKNGDVTNSEDPGEFYVRYYSGRDGKYGFETLEFEIKPSGEVRRNFIQQ